MRIVFMGANQTGFLCLQELLAMGEQVVGVFTVPPRFSISYAKQPVAVATYRPFDQLASAHGVPLVVVDQPMREYVEPLRALRPDLIFVSGWYHLLPGAMLAIPQQGIIGLHPSLLPKYRGGAPLTWAIINGETQAGITLFHLGRGVDDGDIIGQERVAIGPDDTIATVYEQVNQSAVRLVRAMVPRLRQGTAPRIPQDASQASVFPQRAPEDGVIDWSWPARRIHDWVRAQTRPYPGAYTSLDDQRWMIWSTAVLDGPEALPHAPPGSIVRITAGSGVDVATGEGRLRLLEAERTGQPAALERIARPGLRFGGLPRPVAAGV